MPQNTINTTRCASLGYSYWRLFWKLTGAMWRSCVVPTCKSAHSTVTRSMTNPHNFWLWQSTNMNIRCACVCTISIKIVVCSLHISCRIGRVHRLAPRWCQSRSLHRPGGKHARTQPASPEYCAYPRIASFGNRGVRPSDVLTTYAEPDLLSCFVGDAEEHPHRQRTLSTLNCVGAWHQIFFSYSILSSASAAVDVLSSTWWRNYAQLAKHISRRNSSVEAWQLQITGSDLLRNSLALTTADLVTSLAQPAASLGSHVSRDTDSFDAMPMIAYPRRNPYHRDQARR
jgi:hypothetical protein